MSETSEELGLEESSEVENERKLNEDLVKETDADVAREEEQAQRAAEKAAKQQTIQDNKDVVAGETPAERHEEAEDTLEHAVDGASGDNPMLERLEKAREEAAAKKAAEEAAAKKAAEEAAAKEAEEREVEARGKIKDDSDNLEPGQTGQPGQTAEPGRNGPYDAVPEYPYDSVDVSDEQAQIGSGENVYELTTDALGGGHGASTGPRLRRSNLRLAAYGITALFGLAATVAGLAVLIILLAQDDEDDDAEEIDVGDSGDSDPWTKAHGIAPEPAVFTVPDDMGSIQLLSAQGAADSADVRGQGSWTVTGQQITFTPSETLIEGKVDPDPMQINVTQSSSAGSVDMQFVLNASYEGFTKITRPTTQAIVRDDSPDITTATIDVVDAGGAIAGDNPVTKVVLGGVLELGLDDHNPESAAATARTGLSHHLTGMTRTETKIVVPSEGTWEVDGTTITFTRVHGGLADSPSPITFWVEDANGNPSATTSVIILSKTAYDFEQHVVSLSKTSDAIFWDRYDAQIDKITSYVVALAITYAAQRDTKWALDDRLGSNEKTTDLRDEAVDIANDDTFYGGWLDAIDTDDRNTGTLNDAERTRLATQILVERAAEQFPVAAVDGAPAAKINLGKRYQRLVLVGRVISRRVKELTAR